MHRIHVIDSHTEGEPTRIIVGGGPDLGGGTVAQQLAVFRERFDHIRSAVVNEPRGCDHLVGALVCSPSHAGAAAGVIFFNNVGFLNSCGHGTLGLAVTLGYLGRIRTGLHTIETPVGVVTVDLKDGGHASITNVPSYRHAKGVEVEIAWRGTPRKVRGDVAWGGNWFFLVDHGGECGHEQELSRANIPLLTDYSWAVREALEKRGVTGAGGGHIDHIELFGPAGRGDCQSRNFVLCPGREYDRSPCGTGTSAKLACLAADGKLRPGSTWGQESIIGSAFLGSYVPAEDGKIIPTIRGQAFVSAESTLVIDDDDPFKFGIRG